MYVCVFGDEFDIDLFWNDFLFVVCVCWYLFVVGGIGIMLIFVMVCELVSSGWLFMLYYVVCDVVLMVYCDEVVVLLGVICWFDDGELLCGLLLVDVIGVFECGMYLYVCGFVGFIEVMFVVVWYFGWCDDVLYCECFVVLVVMVENVMVEVCFVGLGYVLNVLFGMLIFDVMIEVGFDLFYDCWCGDCGVCVVCLFDGDFDYCDICLSDDDYVSGVFCLCVLCVYGVYFVLDF